MIVSKKSERVGVSIRSANKSYGIFQALDNVSLEVAAGEFVSILGPSGSGKTTFLGILGGFVQPTSGSIWLGERDITFEPPHKRDIGIVFQNCSCWTRSICLATCACWKRRATAVASTASA